MPEANRRHETVSFTIDGRPFTVEDHHETAAALLTLAGLDPASYELGEVRPGDHEPKLFKGDQQVNIHNGERFVSVREHAEVA